MSTKDIEHCNQCKKGRMIKSTVKTTGGKKTLWFCGFCGAEGHMKK